ncbi:MAG TPA: hypothetical protein P5107_09065 [Thermotogota bacterium]|nr:hypothetical protein [Thermotogota bacterium]HRW35190.1 hypothetical protein [Thermotogota bacterium]
MIHIFEKILFFLPFFILIMVSTLFFMLSFSAFSQGTLFQQILGFIIQNIPTMILIALIIISKRHPKWGGALLIIIWLFFLFFFHAYENLSLFFMIIPILIAGLLFWVQDTLSN